MIRACVIGLDAVGRAHAAVYRSDERSELVGVCDAGRERADAAAARLGAPGFTDAAEMLRAARPDLVSVCVAGDSSPQVMLALERGCHVLCEVPLSPHLSRARELVAFARERKLCLAADFNLRFTPAARKAKEWIDQGRLGTPLFINLALWAACADEARNSGAVLRRLTCHAFDMMRRLSGEVSRLQCFATAGPGCREWSSAQINLQFASAVVGGLTVSADMPTQHPLARCEVAGTTARLVVDDIYEEISLYPHAEQEKTVISNSIWGGLGSYQDTHRCRVHSLLEQLSAGAAGAEIEGSGEEALAAQAAVEAAMESARRGGIVEMVSPVG
jgi:predicted dehydrogenase